MKWFYGIGARAWVGLYITAWINPMTVEQISMIGRHSFLALALIFGHIAFDKHKD